MDGVYIMKRVAENVPFTLSVRIFAVRSLRCLNLCLELNRRISIRRHAVSAGTQLRQFMVPIQRNFIILTSQLGVLLLVRVLNSLLIKNLLATNRSHSFKFSQIPISWLNVGRGLCVVLDGRNYPHNAYVEAFQALYCYWSTTTLLVVFLDHQFPFQIRYRCCGVACQVFASPLAA